MNTETGEAPIPEKEEQKKKELTPKQKRFADFYIGEANLNGTKAAKLAEYKGNDATLGAVAYENLRKPQIRFYIDKRLSEVTLTRNEVLARLTAIATANPDDVIDENGNFDFEKAKRSGKIALIKRLKCDGEKIDFEMYSAHEALRDLGKYHRLFAERHEVTATVSTYIMTREQWEADAKRKLEMIEGQLEKFDE